MQVASDEKSVRLLGEMAGTLTPEVPAPGRPGCRWSPATPRILPAGSCGQAGSDAHRDSASAGAVPDRRDPWSSRAKDFSALNLTGTLCM